MRWTGKIIGAGLGFLAGRWLGMVIGLLIGHSYDRRFGSHYNVSPEAIHGLQSQFSNATFLVMGKLAKADGTVNDKELDLARDIMSRLRLSESQRLEAMRLFNEGKQDSFDINSVLKELKELIGRRVTLAQFFVETQLSLAYADGELRADEKRMLQTICSNLGINKIQFEIINQRVIANFRFQQFRKEASQTGHLEKTRQAYRILGVRESDTDAVIKKAYRRLMSQHHPDKLVARGLPPEMQTLAKQKSQEIQQAYATIKTARKT